MAKADQGTMVSAKLPTEVVEAYGRFAGELATSRSALFLEALQAYLPLLRSGRRSLVDTRLPTASEAGSPVRRTG